MRSIHTLLTVLLCPSLLVAAEIWVDTRATVPAPTGSAQAPFRSINQAIKTAAAGDSIVIKAGTYREEVAGVPSGEEGKPLVIKAAPDEKVVLTGFAPLSGWKQEGELLVTTSPTRPQRLLLNRRELPISREPNEGWWTAAEIDADGLKNVPELKSVRPDLAGATAYVWLQRGNNFTDVEIASHDRSAGTITFVKRSRAPVLSANDKFHLKNHPQFIDQPGEWSVVKEGDGYKVSVLPPAGADITGVEMPIASEVVLDLSKTHDVIIDGLEIVGSQRNGVQIHGSERVSLVNCIIHNSGYAGVDVRNSTDVTFRHCVSMRNMYGFLVTETKKVLLEESEIAWNGVDGIQVAWNSEDITIQRCHFHDHLLWGHPDNLQTHNNVTRARFIDNLIVNAGQSLMTQQTSESEMTGNMIVGSMAYMVIFGHGNASGFKLNNNTLAYAGYGCVNPTGRDYQFTRNIFITGHPRPVFSLGKSEGYVGDFNVFWNSTRLPGALIGSKQGQHKTLDQFQQITSQDQNSLAADPMFRNAPVAFTTLEDRMLTKCTRDRMYLRGGSAGFMQGDYVEFNFDGTKRRVKELDKDSITIDPPLDAVPTKTWLVANWGDNSDFTLDLRTRPDSPAHKLGQDGKPAGSNLDIQAYRKGDFNGDGKRDLPDVPEDLSKP